MNPTTTGSTPRTDAKAHQIGDAVYSLRTEVVPAALARELERENAKLREAMNDLRLIILGDYKGDSTARGAEDIIESALAATAPKEENR